MTLLELLSNQKFPMALNKDLTDEHQTVYTDVTRYGSNIFIQQIKPAEGFTAGSKFKNFQKGLCMECGKENKPYSDIFTFTRMTGVKFVEVYGFESGFCPECAKAKEGQFVHKSHDSDRYQTQRIYGQNDYVIRRYMTKGCEVDPIYDPDCEKVEGYEKVDLRYQNENKK